MTGKVLLSPRLTGNYVAYGRLSNSKSFAYFPLSDPIGTKLSDHDRLFYRHGHIAPVSRLFKSSNKPTILRRISLVVVDAIKLKPLGESISNSPILKSQKRFPFVTNSYIAKVIAFKILVGRVKASRKHPAPFPIQGGPAHAVSWVGKCTLWHRVMFALSTHASDLVRSVGNYMATLSAFIAKRQKPIRELADFSHVYRLSFHTAILS